MRRGLTLLAIDSPWKTKIKHDEEGIDPSRRVDKKEKDVGAPFAPAARPKIEGEGVNPPLVA